MSEEKSSVPEVRVYIMGKEYKVPQGLTIMKAMEYAGYRVIRGAGCREGFCGSCATVYRIKGDYKLYAALACQETVQDNMYLAQIPFTPTDKPMYDINELRPTASVLLEHYPEINRCVSCNTCTKACPQDLEVMDYVQTALRGDFEQTSQLSFDCIACGLCATRCPMEISPYRVADLARRLYGKYLMPTAKHTEKRVKEISERKYDKELEKLIRMPTEKLRELYSKRTFDLKEV